METGPPAEFPNPVPETATPARSWVWHATLESRKGGQVSVLACAETIFAVVLYWWIAIRYDTHWHLVSSVFVAPLLLLRSPTSISTGLHWFVHEWFQVAPYRSWQRWKRWLWITAVGHLASSLVFLVMSRILFVMQATTGHLWLLEIIAYSAVTTFFVAFAVSGATLGSCKDKALCYVTLTVTSTSAFFTAVNLHVFSGYTVLLLANALAMIMSLTTYEERKSGATACSSKEESHDWTDLFARFGLTVGFGLGVVLRSLAIRFAFTLRYAFQGFRRLPANWRENLLLTDVFIPAEVIPGIRESIPALSIDGYYVNWVTTDTRIDRSLLSILAPILFLPSLVYRLNIKATAWFWWPLAYLLKPTPKVDAESQAKQALCWPWTNPFQKGWIVVSVVLVLLSLVLHSIDRESWAAWNKVPAIPLALKVSLAIDWQHIAPWHWAQWVIAGSGAIMLALAGNARSHDVNGNWEEYRRSSPHAITWMTILQRVRALATISLLVMALGALAMQEQFWRAYIAVPETWIRALERFYGVVG